MTATVPHQARRPVLFGNHQLVAGVQRSSRGAHGDPFQILR